MDCDDKNARGLVTVSIGEEYLATYRMHVPYRFKIIEGTSFQELDGLFNRYPERYDAYITKVSFCVDRLRHAKHTLRFPRRVTSREAASLVEDYLDKPITPEYMDSLMRQYRRNGIVPEGLDYDIACSLDCRGCLLGRCNFLTGIVQLPESGHVLLHMLVKGV
jgi:hypothetical protein